MAIHQRYERLRYERLRRGTSDSERIGEPAALQLLRQSRSSRLASFKYSKDTAERDVTAYIRSLPQWADAKVKQIVAGRGGGLIFAVRAGRRAGFFKIFPDTEDLLHKASATAAIRSLSLRSVDVVHLVDTYAAVDKKSGTVRGAGFFAQARGESVGGLMK